ncbi:MAG: hypothetical protein K5981_02125 [Clostridia bacterium]|nr:hypothetical protein [Clostridia bacterium]
MAMISKTIAKSNTKDKVIDIRDQLVQARLEDYAALHGAGGKDHAPKSTLKLVLCDYKNKDNGGSVTVSANISPGTAKMLYEKAKEAMSGPSAPMVEAGKVTAVLNFARSIMPKAGESVPRDQFVALGKMLSECSGEVPSICNYSQTRVDIYKQDANGMCPVNILSIVHQPTYKGEPAKNPWFIKITNAKARSVNTAIGGVTFDGKTITDKQEVFINLANESFFDMMGAAVSYVDAWEKVTAAKLIPQAAERLAQERAAGYKPQA